MQLPADCRESDPDRADKFCGAASLGPVHQANGVVAFASPVIFDALKQRTGTVAYTNYGDFDFTHAALTPFLRRFHKALSQPSGLSNKIKTLLNHW